jgi:hypothetical protein
VFKHLKEGGIKKNKGIYEGGRGRWEREVLNVINMIAIVCDNELIFQKLLGHCPT